MALSIIQIFRDYIVDGVPSSGNNKPKKSDVRNWGSWVEGIITAFTSTGGLIFSSLALLNADLAHAANSMAWVIGDATVANNGVYRKNGASGSGSWTRIADLPYSFVKLTDAGAGTPNAIQLTSTIPTSASVLRIANVFEANAGNVTISENGGAAKSLLTSSGNQIAAGGLLASMMIAYVDNGTSFRLLSDQASAAIQAAAEAAQAAAAGSASAAAASAAAAAASAASISLPPIASNRVLVDNAAGTLRESKTFSEAMALLAGADASRPSTFSLDNSTLYKVRALKDRWLDSYRLNEELQFTGGGSVATDAAVLQALFNRAVAAGRGELILPRGDVRLEAAVQARNPSASQTIRIVGQGPDATRLLNNGAAQHWFDIGDASIARTSGVIFEGFSTTPGVTMNDSGTVFNLRNTTDIAFKDIIVRATRNGWSMGVGAGVTNDVVYTTLSNCGGTSPGASGVAMIRLGSGGILNITGGASRWNASGGHIFIDHDNNSWNWDGFYLSGQFFENWSKYLKSTGKGMVNVEWTGGQVDRADIAFHAEPSIAGGSNRNWNIHDVQILGFPAGGDIGCLLSKGSSTDTQGIECMSVNNCQFNGLAGIAIWAPYGEIFANGNIITSCAQLGAGSTGGGSIIRVGQGMCQINDNLGRRALNSPGVAYTTGIAWDGATLASRKAAGNDFFSYSGGAAETGTK